jgi:tRNA nucleotidyltransferase (CCA-adding enzyme)
MKSIMQDRLSQETMDILTSIGRVADEMDLRAYVVGGFVRDLLLDNENLDLDVVAEGNGTQFAIEISKAMNGSVRSYESFGTSTVTLENGNKIDVATARKESYLNPGALPTVERGSIESDLFRRDFTINSLAIILNGDDSFKLIDFFNGQNDLNEKVLRVHHDLSYQDDPCRIFRTIRFEQRLKFSLSEKTEMLLNDAIQKKHFDLLSGHRLWNEIIAILKEKKPLRYFRRMKELRLLTAIHPKLSYNLGDMKSLEKIEKALPHLRMIPLPAKPEEWKIYLMAILCDLNDEEFTQTCKRLSFSEKQITFYDEELKTCRLYQEKLNLKSDFLPSEIFNMFSAISTEAVLLLAALSDKERTKKFVQLYFTEYISSSVPELTGDDLIELGIQPGPLFKTVLNSLQSARLNGLVISREDEVALVKNEYLN